MLHELGVWYFNVGWMIVLGLSFFLGLLAGGSQNPKRNIFLLCIGLLMFGGVMAYFKYGC